MNNCIKSAVFGLVVLLAGCQQIPRQYTGYNARMPATQSTQVSVQQALMSNDQLAVLPIQVNVENNVVQLNGYVKTIRQSDMAGELAAGIVGAEQVQNNLIVRK